MTDIPTDVLTDVRKMAPRVKPLEWQLPQPPNYECRYDHVTVKAGPFRYSVEWESWKERTGYVVYRDDGYLTVADTLEAGKLAAQEDLEKIVLGLLVAPDTAIRKGE